MCTSSVDSCVKGIERMSETRENNFLKRIEGFIKKKGWVSDIRSIRFLAAGEYNENYIVESDSGLFVFRINHGSQLGIDNQIEYEYRVLEQLRASGVTPRPYYCSTDIDAPGNGVLLMEYLEGRALDYRRDTGTAATIFAAVHTQQTGDGMIVQQSPIHDIAAESLRLIECYRDHPMQDIRHRLLVYRDEILELAESNAALYSDEPMCIVNTEVNSENFIIGSGSYLVDWEKAVVSCRYQDLGHFLVPTTTLWKSDFTFDDETRRAFLSAYASRVGLQIDIDELARRTAVMEKTILLRALSWCYMAYYEYTHRERPLKNMSTFQKITEYLEDIECFLG